jgi:hypothetical protein
MFTNHFTILRRLPYKVPNATNLVALFVRKFHYELQKTPVVPINVNSNAFLVNYIVLKMADWLETHL